MNKKELVKLAAAVTAAFTISAAAGFGVLSSSFGTGEKSYAAETAVTQTVETTRTQAAETTSASESGTTANELNMVTGGAVDTTDLFTDRDLEQTADLSEAKTYTISDGQTIDHCRSR